MKAFEPHTAEQHRMWEWIASDLANYNIGRKVGSTPDIGSHERAREQLKESFMLALDYKPSNKPIEEFHAFVDTLDTLQGLGEEDRLNLKLAHIKSIQDMFMKKYKTFSTSQNLFSKQKMTQLIEFCISTLKENNISFRPAIMEMFKEEDYKSYVYTCLKYRMCEVCGKYGELHHVDTVSKTSGTYERDTGLDGRFTCLCREHHSEIDADARAYEKHDIKGIFLTEKMVTALKLVYKNHFKAHKETENENIHL